MDMQLTNPSLAQSQRGLHSTSILPATMVLETRDKTPSASTNLHGVIQGRLQGRLACLLKTIARNL